MMAGATILLVENEKLLAQELQHELTNLGYQVQDVDAAHVKVVKSISSKPVESSKSKQSTSQVVPAGCELFLQGSRAREVYSIEKGLVKLMRQEAHGKETIAALRYRGWLLGATAVILDEPLPVTAVTVTSCTLNRIAAEDFRNLIKNNPERSWKLHQMLAREVHNQVIQLAGIECLTARQRLEELLWQLLFAMESAPSKKPARIQFPAKHSEIAQILAISPQYLSWLIGCLERDKIVKRDKGWLIVYQSEKLWHREELSHSPYLFGSFC